MKLGKLTRVAIAAFCVATTPFTSYASSPEPEVTMEEGHMPSSVAPSNGVVRDNPAASSKAPGRDQSKQKDTHNHQERGKSKASDQGPEGEMGRPMAEATEATSGPTGAADGCVSSDELAAISGSSRIALIKTSTDLNCAEDNLWKSSTANMALLFDQESMISVANEARSLAISYDGTNSNATRLFLNYLRVGVWAQDGNKVLVGDHSSAVDDAIEGFLDAFAANPNYFNTDEVHGYTLKESMILMGSKDFNLRYLPTAIAWLGRYDPNGGNNLQSQNTQALTLVYRGSFQTSFKAHVENDPAVINALNAFLRDETSLLGTSNEFQFNDAASELSRILSYGGQAKETTKVLVRNFLGRYTMLGQASGAWINMASQIESHDSANCSFYGTCNYKVALEAAVLPITHNCGATLRVRAQALTNQQLTDICSDLATHETYFHEIFQTGNVPVADDNNGTLELVIYDNRTDYRKFSGSIFGNSTNNGGQYLEGDPSIVGNIPRFFAYEEGDGVRNLRHEYTHYLDGRFNLYGDFRTANAFNTVLWGEGVADYLAKRKFNDGAITEARNNTYKLSQLTQTTYDNADANRIYTWGYLAMRYMFEEHRFDIDTMLTFLRDGNFQGFQDFQDNTIGTNYDASFAQWLTTVESTTDGGTTDPDPGTGSGLANGSSTIVNSTGDATFALNVPNNATNLVISISGGTGSADLYVKTAPGVSLTDYTHRPWIAGNNETVSVPNPASGAWSVMVAPYANNTFSNVTLTVTWEGGDTTNPDPDPDPGTGTDTCATSSPVTRGNMQSGDAWCLGEQYAHIGIYVTSGTSQLVLTTGHGQGDATLYQSDSTWTSNSRYSNRSNNASTNNESITINNPRTGWHYIGVDGQGSGVTLSAELK